MKAIINKNIFLYYISAGIKKFQQDIVRNSELGEVGEIDIGKKIRSHTKGKYGNSFLRSVQPLQNRSI